MSPPAASLREILRADLGAAGRPSTRRLTRLILLLARPWLTVEGREHLAGLREPAIFAFNHNNSIETLVVPAALFFLRRGRSIAFVVDWMFLRIPLVGWLLGHGDPIPVYTKHARWGLFEGERRRRAAAADSVLNQCRDRLAAGQSVGIFPEGTRNRHADRLGPGRIGLGHLVLATGRPVIPVGIDFPARARLGRVPHVGRLRVRIGAPLQFGVPTPDAARRHADRATATDPAELAWQAGRTGRAGRADRLDRATRERAREVVATVLDRLAALCGKQPPARSKPAKPAMPAGPTGAAGPAGGERRSPVETARRHRSVPRSTSTRKVRA